MKTTADLLKEVTEMGFDREKVLSDIDACLDDVLDKRTDEGLDKEYISDELYNDIIFGYKCELESCNELEEILIMKNLDVYPNMQKNDKL